MQKHSLLIQSQIRRITIFFISPLPLIDVNNRALTAACQMNQLNNFYLQQTEPNKSCLLALRKIILSQDANITNTLKYGMPFFCYKGKMFCYLWIHKKHKQPYIGIVEGKRFNDKFLIQEDRSRMKIMLFKPNEDLPLKRIERILQKAINFYKTGEIKRNNKKTNRIL